MSLKDKALSILGMEEGEEFGLEDIAALSMNYDGAIVPREEFLREVLQGKYTQEMIDQAIADTPSAAGVDQEELKKIAEEMLKLAEENVTAENKIDDLKETLKDEDSNVLKKVKGVAQTVLEDRYLHEAIRLMQKLMYLYGFQELQFSEDGVVCGDKSKLTVMLGAAAMYGVENADVVLKALAQAVPELKEKKISLRELDSEDITKVLTGYRRYQLGKGLVQRVAGSLPVAGSIVRAGTYDSQLEMFWENLISVLSDTALSNSQHKVTPKELAYKKQLLALVKEAEDQED